MSTYVEKNNNKKCVVPDFFRDFFFLKKMKCILQVSNLYWLFITQETLLKVFSFFSVFIISKL